jgi:hypothetical protein
MGTRRHRRIAALEGSRPVHRSDESRQLWLTGFEEGETLISSSSSVLDLRQGSRGTRRPAPRVR